ncbi:MAG: hypothetical protein QXP59_01965 [Saccharolobus sp.]
MVENSIYNYIGNPDRIIFLNTENNPKIHFIKIIGKDFVNTFSQFLNIGLSRFITEETKNQIIGAFVVIKITPEMLTTLATEQEMLDSTYLTNDIGIFLVLKKFLWTNDVQLFNTMSEIEAYLSVVINNQLQKYNIPEEAFVKNRELALFLTLSSKQVISITPETAEKLSLVNKLLFWRKEAMQPKPKEPEKKKEQIEKEPPKPQETKSAETESKVLSNPILKDRQTINNNLAIEEDKEFEKSYKEIDEATKSKKEPSEGWLIVKNFLKDIFVPQHVINEAEEEKEKIKKRENERLELERKKIELAKKKAEYKKAKKPKPFSKNEESEDEENIED